MPCAILRLPEVHIDYIVRLDGETIKRDPSLDGKKLSRKKLRQMQEDGSATSGTGAFASI